ncbi:hypothetical protein RRG08_047649 [Elysia crispata]|uniref:Carbohydrate kinase PfkB domain-containing protein n=1 Tax=Elysia crispata TaxID=231223 RepID=A0AAE0ZWD6_9GAST|nr:hypothetical protein RRG08_047649 [Elysia crispata]
MRAFFRLEISVLRKVHQLWRQKHPPASAVSCYQEKKLFATTSHRNRFNSDFVWVSEEVQDALSSKKAVVALESTIITHGMPYPHNFSTALCVERRVRENGAIPATVAVINGKIHVGLSDTDIIWLAEKNNKLIKISRRDLASVISQGGSGGTTVSATMIAAHMVGIPIFATGGIGGVHRGAESSFDVSADLTELGRTPVAVVSSGVKSILDIPKTLEYLETQGVLVASFSDSCQFPAFFTRDSGHQAPYSVGTHLEAAKMIDCQLGLGLLSGMLIAVPIPNEISPAGQIIEDAIAKALTLARERNITGREVTPFVLSTVNQITQGESLVANIALVENNASVAGGIAHCLAQLRAGVSPQDVKPPPHASSFSILQPAPSPALASAISSSTGRSTSAQSEDSDATSDGSSSDDSHDNESKSYRKANKAHGRPVILGATVLDLTIHFSVKEFQMDGATYPGKISKSFGGVGRNLADCLSRIGLNPVFVSAIGKDISLDGCSHMDLSMVQCLDDQSTAVCCPVLRQDGHQIYCVGDMEITTAFDADKVEDLDKVIMSAPIVMMDGNFSDETILNVAKKCSKYDVPLWYEPTDTNKASKPFKNGAYENISIISPNFNELVTMYEALMKKQELSSDMISIDSADVDEVLNVCVRMCQALVPHIPVVLVTLGSQGVLLCHSHGPDVEYLLPLLRKSSFPESTAPDLLIDEASFHAVHYPALNEEAPISSVSGAGDCLSATFVAAMLEGHRIDECVCQSMNAAELSLASSAAVPETISHDSVLGADARDSFPQWKPRILKTGN